MRCCSFWGFSAVTLSFVTFVSNVSLIVLEDHSVGFWFSVQIFWFFLRATSKDCQSLDVLEILCIVPCITFFLGRKALPRGNTTDEIFKEHSILAFIATNCEWNCKIYLPVFFSTQGIFESMVSTAWLSFAFFNWQGKNLSVDFAFKKFVSCRSWEKGRNYTVQQFKR